MSVLNIEGNGSSGAAAAADIRQLVIFQLLKSSFGLDIQYVREINRLLEVTPIPNAPDYVEGIINLRGTVIPVVSLGLRFGLERSESTKDTRIVVIESNNNVLGLVVDEVSEVLRIPASEVEPAISMATSGVNLDFIEGVGKVGDRLILLLAPDKIFTVEEQEELSDIATT